MLLPFKNYGFTAQKLWFRTSKPMLLKPKNIGFISKHLISSSNGDIFSFQLPINQQVAESASKHAYLSSVKSSVTGIARMRAYNSKFP